MFICTCGCVCDSSFIWFFFYYNEKVRENKMLPPPSPLIPACPHLQLNHIHTHTHMHARTHACIHTHTDTHAHAHTNKKQTRKKKEGKEEKSHHTIAGKQKQTFCIPAILLTIVKSFCNDWCRFAWVNFIVVSFGAPENVFNVWLSMLGVLIKFYFLIPFQ